MVIIFVNTELHYDTEPNLKSCLKRLTKFESEQFVDSISKNYTSIQNRAVEVVFESVMISHLLSARLSCSSLSGQNWRMMNLKLIQ